MVNFLIYINKMGLISKILWCNPVHMIPNRYKAFPDLFSDIEKVYLHEIINACVSDKQFHHTIPLLLKDKQIRIIVYALPVGDQLLVFGSEDKLFMKFEYRDDFMNIVQRFMFKFVEQDQATVNEHSRSRLEFEKIQMLNNELINARRDLEKANVRLNQLNEDLNNRLVKDALTGLISRYQYRTEMEMMIAQNPGRLGIFTFIDVDNFKGINDTYGHATGDAYLIEFANRLKRMILPNTLKLRISGDEFGLFSYGLNQVGAAEIETIWDQLNQHVLNKPIEIDGRELPLSLSAGMSVYGQDTFEIYDLIDYADFAMYQAKRHGKNNYRSFNKEAYEISKKEQTKAPAVHFRQ